MTTEGKAAAVVVEFALRSGSAPCPALAMAGYQIIETTPAECGQSSITAWSPSGQLITLQVAIAGWGDQLMIKEI